jgi:hypothetical protein
MNHNFPFFLHGVKEGRTQKESFCGLSTQDHNHLGFMGARVFIASQPKLTGGLG